MFRARLHSTSPSASALTTAMSPAPSRFSEASLDGSVGDASSRPLPARYHGRQWSSDVFRYFVQGNQPGDKITATATDLTTMNTSELSAAITIA